MSTDMQADMHADVRDELELPEDATDAAPEEADEDSVEIHRDGPVSAAIGLVAAAVAVAYLLRAVGSGSGLDWLLLLVTGTIAGLHLATWADSRAPLMVLDDRGVRVRRGATWIGVAWPEVAQVEHRPRTGLVRDGALSVVDTAGRRLSVRLSMSTRLVGSDWHEMSDAIGELTDGRVVVVEPVRPAAVAVDDDPLEPHGAGADEGTAALLGPVVEPEPAPEPVREPAVARRADVVLERTVTADVEETGPVDDLTSVIALPEPETSTVLIDEAHLAPAVEPVVGPVLATARQRLGLTVDQLAERTRIRPHVIEAIEVDGFDACGGDFYARGHLRTLARVLGVDATPLLEEYDVRYSDAPIDPRRVFEAELATAGAPGRGSGGGLNWSVLVAVVMAVVLVWSVARLVMDGPVRGSDQPVLNGSPGGKASLSGATTKVPVTFTAVTGGARVIVRDGNQQVVFDEQLAFMQTAQLTVAPPVRVSSTDGGLTISVDGVDKGALGASGKQAQQTFVP